MPKKPIIREPELKLKKDIFEKPFTYSNEKIPFLFTGLPFLLYKHVRAKRKI